MNVNNALALGIAHLLAVCLSASGTGTLNLSDVELPANSEDTRNMLEEMLEESPEDPLVNVVYGLWQFADLAESNEFQSILVAVGLPSQIKGSSVFDDAIPNASDFYLNTQYPVSELRTYTTDTFLPTLDSLDERFGKLGTGQVIQLDKDDFDLEQDLKIDYADMLLLRAAVKAYAFWIRLELGYSADPSLADLAHLGESGQVSVESVRDSFSNLGAVYDASLLAQAGQNLQSAIDLYQEASPLLWDASRTSGLILLESKNLDQETQFSEHLAALEQALQGNYSLKYVHNGAANVLVTSLQPLFQGAVDFSTLLPDSIGNKFADISFPDPTFAGLVPNMTNTQLRTYAEEAGLFGTNIWHSVEPLVDIDWWDWWQSDQPGYWWQSYWFGYFYKRAPESWIELQNRNFPDAWMYHLRMGWLYCIASTPKNIWFWKQDSGQWLWASSSYYPVLYDYAADRWLLLSETDGSFDFWNGSSWQDLK